MNKLWVVIPAAGKGVRFGSQVPKQYVSIDGQAVLDHVLDAFLKIGMFETILVAVASQDYRFKLLARAKHRQVASTIGGLKRSDSVLRSLEWLEMHGALETEWVFVHDAARPLITQGELYALCGAIDIRDCPGAVLGAPGADTLKRVDQVFNYSEESEIRIVETIDRTALCHAMTPQVFRLGDLKNALMSAKAAGLRVNDESQAMEAMNKLPWFIRGQRSNVKLTYPEDLELIDAILSFRRQRQ